MPALPVHLVDDLDPVGAWYMAQEDLGDPLPTSWPGTHRPLATLRERMAAALADYPLRMAARAARDVEDQEHPDPRRIAAGQLRYWQRMLSMLDAWRLGAGVDLELHPLARGWLDVGLGAARLVLFTEATYRRPVAQADCLLATDVLQPILAALRSLLNYTLDPLDPGSLSCWLHALQVRVGVDPDTEELYR